jgi:hypothetical protein
MQAALLRCHRLHGAALPLHCFHWRSAGNASGVTSLLRRSC